MTCCDLSLNGNQLKLFRVQLQQQRNLHETLFLKLSITTGNLVFPARNVLCITEAVATDTVFIFTPSVYSGFKSSHIFIGCTSFVADLYGNKTEKLFVRTVEYIIHERREMCELIIYASQAEIIIQLKAIFHLLVIVKCESESYNKNHSFTKNGLAPSRRPLIVCFIDLELHLSVVY